MFESYRKCKKTGVERRFSRVKTKSLLAQTVMGQTIWNKMEKNFKIGEKTKNFYLFLCVFYLLFPKPNFSRED